MLSDSFDCCSAFFCILKEFREPVQSDKEPQILFGIPYAFCEQVDNLCELDYLPIFCYSEIKEKDKRFEQIKLIK